MKYLLLFAAIFLVSFQRKHHREHKRRSEPLRYLTYGYLNSEKLNARSVVAKRWSIEFFRVGDCDISDIPDSVEQHNRKVDSILAIKHGENWWDEFYREVDEEYAIEQRVEN